LIDLSALVSGFTYIATSRFSGSGPEVRVLESANGDTRVLIDSDGAGGPETRILLVGTLCIDANDFIF
jgi:serralysin